MKSVYETRIYTLTNAPILVESEWIVCNFTVDESIETSENRKWFQILIWIFCFLFKFGSKTFYVAAVPYKWGGCVCYAWNIALKIIWALRNFDHFHLRWACEPICINFQITYRLLSPVINHDVDFKFLDIIKITNYFAYTIHNSLHCILLLFDKMCALLYGHVWWTKSISNSQLIEHDMDGIDKMK